MRIAINGFGRIGKNITRHLIDAGFLAGQNGDLELVAINDLGDIKSNSHLLKYDSIHGSIPNNVSHSDSEIIIDNSSIKFYSERDPSNLPWDDLKIDIVLNVQASLLLKKKLIVI